MRIRSLALFLLIGVTASTIAQPLPPERGEVVRLVVLHPALRSPESVTGTFDGLGRDSLYLTEDRAYPRDLVRSVEVARGRTTYALSGAAIGGGLGGLVGSTLGVSADHADLPQRGERAQWWVSGLIGTGAGLVVGGLIGSQFRRTRWEWTPLHAPTALAPSSRLGLRVGYRVPPAR